MDKDFEFVDNVLLGDEPRGKAPVVDGTFMDDEDYQDDRAEGSGPTLDPDTDESGEEPTVTPTVPSGDSPGTHILFIYCHLYSAFSIVQCSNVLYRL